MLCALLHFGKLKGIDISLELKVWYTRYFFERLHFVNRVKNKEWTIMYMCTCIMVMNNCCVTRYTLALLLFKFIQGLILLVQACTVSTHPQTTHKNIINLHSFVMNRKPQNVFLTKLMSSYIKEDSMLTPRVTIPSHITLEMELICKISSKMGQNNNWLKAHYD